MVDNSNSRIRLISGISLPWDISMLKLADFIASSTTIVYNRVETCNFPILTCSAYNIFWSLDYKHSA